MEFINKYFIKLHKICSYSHLWYESLLVFCIDVHIFPHIVNIIIQFYQKYRINYYKSFTNYDKICINDKNANYYLKIIYYVLILDA